MKNISNFCLLLFCASLFMVSCSTEVLEPVQIEEESLLKRTVVKQVVLTDGLEGIIPCLRLGAGCFPAPTIPSDGAVISDAIAYVDQEAPDHVVAGIEIINRSTIKYHLLYQGEDYRAESNGMFQVGKKGIEISESAAKRLGANSIKLLGGEYAIQEQGDEIWSGYVVIKAEIK